MAVCESCASEDEELVAVWPAASDGEAPELWCANCRDAYPHELAEESEEAEAAEDLT